MAIKEPIDWMHASIEERQRLYKVTKPIKDMLQIDDWNDFLKPILSTSRKYGKGYDANFNSGDISRLNAMEIHGWIVTNHLAAGQRLASDLFPLAMQTPWDHFICEHGVYDSLGTINPLSHGLTRRDSISPLSDRSITLEEPYCFELESSISGYALAFESHDKKDWHPIALGETDAHFSYHCVEGKSLLPFDKKEDKPFICREHEDIGIRRFVLIVGRQNSIQTAEMKLLPEAPVHLSTLNEIAYLFKDTPKQEFSVHRLNVVFKEKKG